VVAARLKSTTSLSAANKTARGSIKIMRMVISVKFSQERASRASPAESGVKPPQSKRGASV